MTKEKVIEIQAQILNYINCQPEPKRNDLLTLHNAITALKPGCRLWYLDGKNSEGKVVSNPNTGYGSIVMKYADGSSREFYCIGLSANTSGISVYIMGLNDKNYLKDNFGKSIGSAQVTGYCIKFKALKEINFNVLMQAVNFGFENSGA